MIRVVWLNRHVAPGHISRGFWDQGIVEAAISGDLYPHGIAAEHLRDVPDGGMAVVVLPARWHEHDLDWVNEQIGRLDACLLILTGDEEGAFPIGDLKHDRLRVWVQTPHGLPEGAFALEDGWPPAAPRLLRQMGAAATRRPLDWFFAGQLNNAPRRALAAELAEMGSGRLLTTDTFGSGWPYHRYLRGLASAKVVPCPSGLFTVDTLRLFEALEAGCLPVAEAASPNRGSEGYWQILYGEEPPFPIVDDWAMFRAKLPEWLEAWPSNANRAFAWWQQRKRAIGVRFADDLAAAAGVDVAAWVPPITVLMPTSPIPSHPSLEIVKATIRSVRAQLPDAEILLMIDGCRPEQAHLAQSYEEYQRRLLWWINHQPHITPVRFDEFSHQAAMTRHTLDLVHTPLILFVEHDTPLEGEIPWQPISEVLQSDLADVIRFHHETQIPFEHGYLMRDMLNLFEVPLLRTIQWSQRPAIARADYYRRVIKENFRRGSRTMIEDRMHGVVYEDSRHGRADLHRIYIYHPEGSILRSRHTDGREGEPKFSEDMSW